MHKPPYKVTFYSFGAVYNTDTFNKLEDARQRAIKYVDVDGGSSAIILDSKGNHVETFYPNPQTLS